MGFICILLRIASKTCINIQIYVYIYKNIYIFIYYVIWHCDRILNYLLFCFFSIRYSPTRRMLNFWRILLVSFCFACHTSLANESPFRFGLSSAAFKCSQGAPADHALLPSHPLRAMRLIRSSVLLNSLWFSWFSSLCLPLGFVQNKYRARGGAKFSSI